MTKYVPLIQDYLDRLFPLCRSITGNANRQTLAILGELIPLDIFEIPSHKHVYDWQVPPEWNISSAWIEDSNGNRLVDFCDSNLHVVSYSIPVDCLVDFDILKNHLHLHPTIPSAIPYRTTYYKRDWGFCVTQQQFNSISNSTGPFHVVINSSLDSGSLTYGELVIRGCSKKEILISSYICHPSMANDSISGVILSALLARELLSSNDLKYTYRFVFVPETIGAIAYCHQNESIMKNIDFGFVVTTVGGPGDFHIKHSYDRHHFLNDVVLSVFSDQGIPHKSFPFDIHGSDERQYSSQAFGINICTIAKDKYYEYPYYHSSLDDLSYVLPDNISLTFDIYLEIISRLESLLYFKSTSAHCEVMLSKHDLYSSLGGSVLPSQTSYSTNDLVLWLLFYCDGNLPLQFISSKLQVPLSDLLSVVNLLVSKGLLEQV